MLIDDEMPPITLDQDHRVFLRILASAKDSPMTRAYIKAHIHLIMRKRANPEAFPMTEDERMALIQGGPRKVVPQASMSAPPEGAGLVERSVT